VTDERHRGREIAIRCISLYQAARAGRPTSCRFHPSCSAYAAEAIGTHGLVRGIALAARRLLRCRPFGTHGIDEVPPVSSGALR
jgi:putative membrane protein insertion efficiency factor